MTAGRYGPWGTGLPDGEHARALAAVGLTAAVAPDVLHGDRPASEIAERLRAALSDRERGAALPWRDPRLVERWDPVTAPPPPVWAAAWTSVDLPRPLRIALHLRPDEEAADRLAATLAAEPVGASAFVALDPHDTPAPWRFPLRIGVLERELRDELVRRFAGSSWRARLIEPVVLGRERVTCDLLVLTLPPKAALDALHRIREVRAAAVLDARGRWDRALVDELIEVTGAWAVGFADVPDPAAWLVEITRELSHNRSLDQAFTATTGRFGGLLAARPDVAGQQRMAGRARSVADALRRTPPAAAGFRATGPEMEELALGFESIAAADVFVSEEAEASASVELEQQAAPILAEAAATRRLQARISRTDAPEVVLSRFQSGTEHRVQVRIAAGGAEWLAASAPFPEESLPPTGPHRLTVVLAEPRLLARPIVREVELPAAGSSSVAEFPFTTDAATVSVDVRLIVLSGNRVLQTARLPRGVDPPASPSRWGQDVLRRFAAHTLAVTETVVAPAAADLADRRTFDAAFVVDGPPGDGATGITAVAGPTTATVKLDSIDVADALRELTRNLADIVDRPDDFAALDAPGTVELLAVLAHHGALMRDALVHDTPNLAEVLAASRYLQVVSAKADAFFPFELAYDFPAPLPGADRLCPEAAAALRSEDLDATCPGPHGAETVCPFGFWGLTRVIERHAFQPETEVAGSFLVRGRPTRDRNRIELGGAVLAASAKVDSFAEGSIGRVLTSLTAAAGSPRQVAAWEEWPDAVAADPSLLMLLPHTVFDDGHRVFGLEIGELSRRWAGQLARDFVPAERPVIVTLLGCDTAKAGEVGYERFPGLLRRAGAEVVIATLTEILGRHAAPVAERLVHELYTFCADEPHGVGEIMVRLRRRLLADGLPMVLALAVFGDADWLVTAARR